MIIRPTEINLTLLHIICKRQAKQHGKKMFTHENMLTLKLT